MAIRTGTETNERREQIVGVAMRHFAEHGYRGAHVEDIAAEVGVAKGTVFLHFGNKEGLVPRRVSGGGRTAPGVARRPRRGRRGRVLGRPGLLAPADRGVPHRAVGGQPCRDDRAVRHRAGAPAADRPADAERGSVRDPRARRVRGPSRRDPRRRRRRDDRLDARLGRRTLPGRPRERGARPRPGPSQALRPRTARRADPGVPRAPAFGHLPCARDGATRRRPDVRPRWSRSPVERTDEPDPRPQGGLPRWRPDGRGLRLGPDPLRRPGRRRDHDHEPPRGARARARAGPRGRRRRSRTRTRWPGPTSWS